MGWQGNALFGALLLVGAAINGVLGDAMVTGTVFCDQCKDGQVSLFDFPLNGIKVSMFCPSIDGQMTVWREETTNWLGNYVMRLEGNPDLRSCLAQVSGGGQGSTPCGAVAGPARGFRLVFGMFDMEVYNVDPLVSQPAQPMDYCPRSDSPLPSRVTPPLPQRPPARVPTPPRLPPLPPLPYLEPSACPHNMWMMPEHRCFWRLLSPDTKVAVVFGLLAARKYGTDITLWQAMSGRGDPSRTLLREATTALLNSYNSIQFAYSPPEVVTRFNLALAGSTRQSLLAALRFIRANSGGTCKFTPCT